MSNGKPENTELSKKLKAIYEASLKRRWAAAQAAKKAKKKSKKTGGADDEHVDEGAPLKGILGKGDKYAERAHDYIKSLDGRGVYRNFSFPHLDEIRDAVRKQAEFPGGPLPNFNPAAKWEGKKAGQAYPYRWEAHHMLPGSAFYYVVNGKPAFTLQQLRLILQSDYNVNHGHNMIMLPDESWAVPVHTLLQHPGDHPVYTQKVMSDMKRISDDIQKKIDNAEPHATIIVDIFEQLKDLEEDYWDYLVNLSRAAVASIAAGKRFVHDHVRYEPAKGDSKYDWGALY